MRTGNRSVQIMASLSLAGCLVSCATGLQTKPGQTAQGAGQQSVEARLQAVEASMQQLTARLDAIRPTVAGAQTDARHASAMPLEYRPIKPVVVLASNPVRKASPEAVIPVNVPAPAPVISPKVAPRKAPVTPLPRQRKGDWVINLASYRNASYAARKLAEFAGKGVDAEQGRAEVKGKTIYRLYVSGFDSSRAASTEATAIRAKLGLGSTWIARR